MDAVNGSTNKLRSADHIRRAAVVVGSLVVIGGSVVEVSPGAAPSHNR